MSPRAPDPRVKTSLIEAAARLLNDEGPDALTTRRLATEVGTSTMAVYTYFRGMDDLRRAVRIEGFERLARSLAAIDMSDDTVADVAALGAAYFFNAITNPHLYRQMFSEPPDIHDPEVGHSTLETLVEAVRRAVEAGRFEGDPWALATQCWAAAHGVVTLHLAGILTFDEAVETFTAMGRTQLIGFGDDPDATDRAIADARERIQKAIARGSFGKQVSPA